VFDEIKRARLGLIFNTTKMTNIINLTAARKTRRQNKANGNTLCLSGVPSNRPTHQS
jgi:hypothetical protein